MRHNLRDEADRLTLSVPDLNVEVSIFPGGPDGGPPQIHVEAGPPVVSTEALNRALGAFWRSVAESFPQAVTGDEPFDRGDAHDIYARRAINLWLENNHPRPLLFVNGEERTTPELRR